MCENGFYKNSSGYRLMRTNSSEFPCDHSCDNVNSNQRRSNFVRETCLTPDSCNRSFIRFCDQDRAPYMSHWNFHNYSDNSNNGKMCKCETSTPRLHQQDSTNSMTRHDGDYLRFQGLNSPNSNIPNYYSLKNPNRKQHFFTDSKTLGRQKNKDRMSANSDWIHHRRAGDIKGFQSEHCLNWLEATNEYSSIEDHMKELDTSIELLRWKKKHLESIQLQKLNTSQGAEVLMSHQPDSPPPMSDLTKPDLSVDDGFESVADACNNSSVQHISDLEIELRKQHLKTKMYEAMLSKSKLEVDKLKQDFKKQETNYKSEIEKLKDVSGSNKKRELPVQNSTPTESIRSPTSHQPKTPAVRPKSFKKELFPSTFNKEMDRSCETPNSDVLALKAELMIKDQHLKKLRITLKELSMRHNELLELHMHLVKSQTKSSSPSLSNTPDKLTKDLSCIVGDLQKVCDIIGQEVPSDSKRSRSAAPVSAAGNELAKLQQSVEKLKLEVERNYSGKKINSSRVK